MENNKIDQFYKDSLAGYETEVSDSFWLRLKWRLLWFNMKYAWLGLGALLLIGAGIFSAYYLTDPEMSNPMLTSQYQSRQPEALAALLAFNDESFADETAISSQKTIVEETHNRIDKPLEKAELTNNKNIQGQFLSGATQTTVSFGSNSASPPANTETGHTASIESEKPHEEIDLMTGLSLSILPDIQPEIDTTLSPWFNKEKKSWLSLTLYASPAYTSAQITPNGADAEYLNYRKDHETATLSWSAGLDLQLNFKNWYVQTGLAYSAFSNKRNYNHSFYAVDSLNSYYAVDTTWGLVFDPPELGRPVIIGIDSTLVASYNDLNEGTNEWKYIEIPLVFGYKFNLNRFGIDIGTGLSYGYLAGVTGNVPSLREKNIFTDLAKDEQQYVSHQVNYILQLGVSYYVTPKWSLVAQPYFKQNILSVFDTNYPVEERFRAFGIKLGLKINL